MNDKKTISNGFNTLEKEIIRSIIENGEEISLYEEEFVTFNPIDFIGSIGFLISMNIIELENDKIRLHADGKRNIFLSRWRIYRRDMPWRRDLDERN